MSQETTLFNLNPPHLFEYSIKPKVLYVADVPNWSFDIKGHQYRKYLPQFEIDIGYARCDLAPEFGYWEDMMRQKKYDVIWHLHGYNVPGYDRWFAFVADQNKKGTQFILTQNEVTPLELIQNDLRRYAVFNALSVNNPWAFENFSKAGFSNIYTTFDGVDLHVFGPDMPIQKRKFKVFFSSSIVRLDHKGYPIWQRVKELLAHRTDIEFVEILTDSFNNKRTPEEMNSLYNECQVFVCLSISEGGPCTLHEAAACGCVPIMTKVGYCDYFKNLFIIDRNAEACAEKILFLKDNPEILFNMSRGISKEILPWHDKFMSQHWGHFIQQSLLKKKGIKLP